MSNEEVRTSMLIKAYRVIGVGRSVVLVAPDGAIDWGCFPDFESSAIFYRLLDMRQGGYFQIAPSATTLAGSQHYLRGSNVLRTTFASDTGRIVLTDFMPVETLDAGSYREMNNNTWAHDDGSCHCLVRSVECTDGELPITMTLKVTPEYAASPSEAFIVTNERGAVISSDTQHVGLAIVGAYRLSSFSIDVSRDETDAHPSVRARIILREGERLQFALGLGRSAQAARRLVEVDLPQRNFDWELAHTLHCWRRWVAQCAYRGPHADWGPNI